MLKTVTVPLAGHPDKICDQIVDAIVDEYLRRDNKSRVNIKALGSNGMLMIGGSVDSRADFDCSEIAKKVYKRIGYEDDVEPFVNIDHFSEDLSRNIAKGYVLGTSLVYGYATKETREFLPKPLVYAQEIAKRIDDLRRVDSSFSWLRPDGKVQLTMRGGEIVLVTLLVQHIEKIELSNMKAGLFESVITPILGNSDKVKIFINPAGEFSVGGFSANAGASGMQVLSDTYGGLLPNGGSSFTGKDPRHSSKAGMYMARYVAKKLVKEGVAGNILISVNYLIGQSDPVYIKARTGHGKDISRVVKDNFDFNIESIVDFLGLDNPIYEKVASYGVFGRDGLPWEDVD